MNETFAKLKSSSTCRIPLHFGFILVVATATLPLMHSDVSSAHEGRLSEHQAKTPSVDHAVPTSTIRHAQITHRFEIYGPNNAQQLRAVKQLGVTQVIVNRPYLHLAATNLGLDVVVAYFWDQDTAAEEFEEALQQATRVENGRLLGISLMDEPERNAPDTPFAFYRSLYQRLRRELDITLPEVGLEISHWGPLQDWPPLAYRMFIPLYQAVDTMRIMPYPDLFDAPLREVFDTIQRSRQIMTMANRKLDLIVILQTWIAPPSNQLPTINELRVMAYQAVLSGSTTVSFYDYNPEIWNDFNGFHDGFASLLNELTSLGKRYHNADISTTMSPDGILRSRIAIRGTLAATIVVNTNRHAVDNLEALEVIECVHALPLRGRRRIWHTWRKHSRHCRYKKVLFQKQRRRITQ